MQSKDVSYSYKYNRFFFFVPPKSKGDWAFISHMLEVANEHGKVGVVIPHGVLFRGAGEGKIRQQTVEENLLEAIIGLPANLFYGTGIPAAIAIFNKAKKCDEVLFIDASREFENGKSPLLPIFVEDTTLHIGDYKTNDETQRYKNSTYGLIEERLKDKDFFPLQSITV